MNTNLTEADLVALRRLVEAVQRLANKIGGVSSQLFAVEMAALNLPADILDRLTHATPAEPAKPEACEWTQDWEGSWEASCGLSWGGDDIGGMNFCLNCGRPVTAKPYTEEEEPTDA